MNAGKLWFLREGTVCFLAVRTERLFCTKLILICYSFPRDCTYPVLCPALYNQTDSCLQCVVDAR